MYVSFLCISCVRFCYVVRLEQRDISYADRCRMYLSYLCDVLGCIIWEKEDRGKLIISYAQNFSSIAITHISNLSLPPTKTTAAHQHHSIILLNHGS